MSRRAIKRSTMLPDRRWQHNNTLPVSCGTAASKQADKRHGEPSISMIMPNACPTDASR